MLREGFDVSNICVIVPLRATKAKILLEQTIGRGLRQMWREPEFADIKRENRKRILEEHQSQTNYIDILSIIEHPSFFAFYDELMNGYYATENEEEENDIKVTGDMITVPLRAGYERYDFAFPIVLRDAEETIKEREFSLADMRPYGLPFEEVSKVTGKGERFVSVEVTAGTRFDPYTVTGDLFPATSYNDYVRRIVIRASALLAEPLSARHLKKDKKFPVVQIIGSPDLAQNVFHTSFKKSMRHCSPSNGSNGAPRALYLLRRRGQDSTGGVCRRL